MALIHGRHITHLREMSLTSHSSFCQSRAVQMEISAHYLTHVIYPPPPAYLFKWLKILGHHSQHNRNDRILSVYNLAIIGFRIAFCRTKSAHNTEKQNNLKNYLWNYLVCWGCVSSCADWMDSSVVVRSRTHFQTSWYNSLCYPSWNKNKWCQRFSWQLHFAYWL